MSNTTEFAADRLPRVTVRDVRRFADTVEIRDAPAFAAELQDFVHEWVRAARRSTGPQAASVRQTLGRKAAALRASERWSPDETAIQRGQTALLEAFRQPHNLPVSRFAELADRSRQQIYKNIAARRLLSLSMGGRGQKLPDWQLDPVKQELTQTVLEAAQGIDNWTLYRALSEPLEGLGGRSPVDAVTSDAMDDVAEAVFNVLGVHAH